MTLDEAKKKFRRRRSALRGRLRDPDNEHDWADLIYGWLLAHGFEPGEDTYVEAWKMSGMSLEENEGDKR